MVCLYVMVPIGLFMKFFVSGSTLRHLYSMLVGIFLQWYMYRNQIIHTLIISTVAYFMMAFLDRKFQQKAIFVFVVGYLSSNMISEIHKG